MRSLDLGSAEQVEQDLSATPCRNAEEEVQRILRVQRNYYTVLKVTQEEGTVFDAATRPNQFCLCNWYGRALSRLGTVLYCLAAIANEQ